MHKLNRAASGTHYVLIGPYSERFTKKLREAVPSTHREWRPVGRCWRIREPFDQAVRDLIESEADR